jgi:hypothetical protein
MIELLHPLPRKALFASPVLYFTNLIVILGAVTSLHMFLTKPVKSITIFLFVPQDSVRYLRLSSNAMIRISTINDVNSYLSTWPPV